jgi:hypothetical protein
MEVTFARVGAFLMGTSEVMKLDEVLRNGLIATRVAVTKYGGKSTRTLTAKELYVLMPQLLECLGEYDGHHWAATGETCKRFAKQTILVRVEEFRKSKSAPVAASPGASPSWVAVME